MNTVVFEVLRNRLLAITEEMRIALQSVSGSPTVTEATDFFTGLYEPDGTFATMGFQVTHEASPVGGLIRHLLSDPRTVLRPGDMFIGNDPYVAALHQNDVQLAGPIFVDGEVIAWAGVMAHQTDVGGMDFASWSPTAQEVYQEGLRIPAVKLVDQGEVRHDVLEMITTASRLPAALELDIRAFIATLNVAGDRIRALVDRYGADTCRAAMTRMVELSERRVRDRLREIPDVTVHVRDFLEHDGHSDRLYRVDLVATKIGDALTLDFSGSSEQAPGFINATRAGLRGGVTGALIPALGFDIPWNDGLLRPIEIMAPDGLICTARFPAPVGSATVETIWVVTNVVHRALNMLLALSSAYAHRAQAVSCGTMATFNLGGVNQYGERFGVHLLDPLGGGFGAWPGRDGIDAGGPPAVPVPGIADVERNEQAAPLHYLYRRLRPDTGGPGRRRGGRAAEMAVTVTGDAEALVMTHGLEVPNGTGLFGGLPGATVSQRFGRDALTDGYPDGPLPADLADLGGDWTTLGPKPGRLPMTPRDVFCVSWQGGGGYGDPLTRDPADVADDVASGAVGATAAREVYGVVLDGHGRPDGPATERLRDDIRAARLGGTPAGAPAEGDLFSPLGPALDVVHTPDGPQVRTRAGAVLADGHTRWRAGSVLVRGGSLPGVPALHPDLETRAFYCPLSGELLAIDVDERDADVIDDVDLHLR